MAVNIFRCVLIGACVVLAASCDRQAAGPAAAEPPPNTKIPATADTPKPAFGSFGFDVKGMNASVAAGDDFFDHVNGTWVKDTEIPSDRSGISNFSLIDEAVQKDLKVMLEGAAADRAADGERRQMGDYYAAFMDEESIAAKGAAPITTELAAIAEIADKKALATALGESLRADVDLLNATNYHTDHLFGLWVSQDLNKPSDYAAYLVQGGLGMPDRDFYLEDGRMAELRTQYQAHIAKMFTLAGVADADAKAVRVVALETAMARVHASQLQTNDVAKGNNVWTNGQFSKKAPGLDWTAFMAAAGLDKQSSFVVWQPAAITGLSKLVATESLDAWKNWLSFHAIDRAAPYLPKEYSDQYFAFHDHALSGTPEQMERWKRGIDQTNTALGEAVGKVYVERHFSPETKARADTMVANILAAFGKRIDAVEWMTAPTKARAQAKLATLTVSMGYPAKWRDYSTLEVRRDDALGNAERASLFEYQRNLAKLGKPVDHDEWFMLPQTVNALNVPLENRLIFPAAILQPPFFDGAADDAVNYGAIGAIIGHEITHSFDNSGALFDEKGRYSNWWTPEDLKQFEAAGAALATQFDAYAPFPDLHVNGKLTLGENIADVAGLATAYDAYTQSRVGKPDVAIDGYTPDQRFFLGFGQAWRGKYREPALRNRVLTDVHAPGQFRAQTVRNNDAWYPAFDVKDGQKLYLAPAQRVKVW